MHWPLPSVCKTVGLQIIPVRVRRVLGHHRTFRLINEIPVPRGGSGLVGVYHFDLGVEVLSVRW